MFENYILKGLLIGLIFGVPAGAIGALTIQRTLRSGFWSGLFTGLGSSAADILYACVGVFGVTLVSDFLLAHQKSIGLVGGVLILLLGGQIFRRNEKAETREEKSLSLPLCFLSAFTVAITNPATILSFLMAFAAFEISGVPSWLEGVQLLSGILLGTVCWWGTLSGVTTALRKHVTDQIYGILNRILGGLLLAFGAAVIVRSVMK